MEAGSSSRANARMTSLRPARGTPASSTWRAGRISRSAQPRKFCNRRREILTRAPADVSVSTVSRDDAIRRETRRTSRLGLQQPCLRRVSAHSADLAPLSTVARPRSARSRGHRGRCRRSMTPAPPRPVGPGTARADCARAPRPSRMGRSVWRSRGSIASARRLHRRRSDRAHGPLPRPAPQRGSSASCGTP